MSPQGFALKYIEFNLKYIEFKRRLSVNKLETPIKNTILDFCDTFLDVLLRIGDFLVF